jgi:hypothetical protein
VKIEEDNKRIYVRQSWLGDTLMCMQRGKFQITHPEFRSGSDATIMGTAVHTAIERVLVGDVAPDRIAEVAQDSLEALMEEDNWKQTNIKPETMMPHTGLMAETWVRDIMPHVTFGGEIEYKFKVPTPASVQVGNDLYEIWFEGTMDYLSPDGVLWDWKTSSRKYSQSEKQKQNVQSSVYAYAAVFNELSHFPVTFNFGVMTRANNSQGQIVPVQRTEAHGQWIVKQTASIVQSAMRIGRESNWPINDQHFLCSESWCSWWSICKGSHVSDVEQQWSQEAQ